MSVSGLKAVKSSIGDFLFTCSDTFAAWCII